MSGELSALGEVIDSSTRGELSPELKSRQAFSDRTRQARLTMQALLKMPGAKGVIKDSDFDEVFNTVKTIWEREPLDWKGARKAFQAVEDALEDAQDRLALHLSKLEEDRRAREAFDSQRQLLLQRADALIKGNFVPAGTFDGSSTLLQQMFDRQEWSGTAVDQAFEALLQLIIDGEARADQAQRLSLSLTQSEGRLTPLRSSPHADNDRLLRCDQGVSAVRDLLSKGDLEGAQSRLDTLNKQIQSLTDAVKKVEGILDKRDELITLLCNEALQELKISEDDLLDTVNEDQLLTLLTMAHERAIGTKTQRGKAAERIRLKYREFEEANREDEEDEEEVEEAAPPEETETERDLRVHAAKLQRRSWTALKMLHAEGEIYRTVCRFQNRGTDFKLGSTGKKGDKVPDYCAGYEIYMSYPRRGSAQDGHQYKPAVVVHFHFSDKGYSKIERAHLKDSHGGKSHWLIPFKDQDLALKICKGE